MSPYSVWASEAINDDYSSITINDLAGLTGAVKDGTIQDQKLEELIDSPKIAYYKTLADECLALELGKVDYVFAIREQYSAIAEEYEGLVLLPGINVPCGEVGFIFTKSSEGSALKQQFDSYINELKVSGELSQLQNYWFTPGSKHAVSIPSKGKNGVINLASAVSSPPFIYVSGDTFNGYEVELLAGFARAYGYGINIEITEMSGILPAVTSGKCIMAANCLMKTPEREEAADFSYTTAEPMFSILVRKQTADKLAGITSATSPQGQKENFISGLVKSFKKTFINENRWRLVLSGLKSTLLITLLSGIIGILLGFQFYKAGISKYALLRKGIGAFNSIMSGTPMVVLLMIFYYVIFGRVDLSPFIVAVIAFSLNFASSISAVYRTCIDSIDPGQMEAALALGYTPYKAFHRFIMPQALLMALPLIKGQLIALLKGTAIVGFISVQDLTKMGDIIRSRTYEAFFPLISIALIYYCLAWLIRVGIDRLIIFLDPVCRRQRRLNKQKGGKA